MVAHNCNPRTQESETQGPQIQPNWLHSEILSIKSKGWGYWSSWKVLKSNNNKKNLSSTNKVLGLTLSMKTQEEKEEKVYLFSNLKKMFLKFIIYAVGEDCVPVSSRGQRTSFSSWISPSITSTGDYTRQIWWQVPSH